METIYTDGSCLGNPGPGGWGVVSETYKLGGGCLFTTNNIMELTAVVRGIENCTSKNITIYTDSKYVKNGITIWIHKWLKNGWKTSSGSDVKNKELWESLWNVSQKKEISWNWVKAHSTDEMNNKVDLLARSIAEVFKKNLL